MGDLDIVYVTWNQESIKTVGLKLDDTIETLKHRIQDKESIAPNKMHLSIAGKQLEDDQTLRECGFTELGHEKKTGSRVVYHQSMPISLRVDERHEGGRRLTDQLPTDSIYCQQP